MVKIHGVGGGSVGFSREEFLTFLVDAFRFEADPQDSTDLAENGNVEFEEVWTKPREDTFLGQIETCFNDGSNTTALGGRLDLVPESILFFDSTNTDVIMEADYLMALFWFDLTTSAPDSIIFGGSLRWLIVQEDSWKIARWWDFRLCRASV